MKSRFLATEKILKQFMFLFIVLLFVLTFGIVGFLLSGDSVTGAFVHTIEALSGGHEGVGSKGFLLTLSMFGTLLMWFAVWEIFGLTAEGKIGDLFKEVRMISDIKSMSKHYVICGAGKVGRYIGYELAKEGHKVVFIEKDKDIINKLKAEKFPVIDVGPIDEHVLKEAGIEKAAGVAIALGDDGKNLLLTITARELNPHAKIAVRAADPKIVPKLHKAGADFILLPEALGGIKLANALVGKVDKSLVFVNEYKNLT